MKITEVKIKLAERRDEKLQAFASITLDDCFVVRDIKVIKGNTGLFVAMPSQKLSDNCPRCRNKNHLRSQFCSECGSKLRPPKTQMDERGRAKLHADIAHPINQDCRDNIHGEIIAAFALELERAKQSDYKPQDFNSYEDFSEPVREPSRLGMFA